MKKTREEMEGKGYPWWMGLAYREFITDTVVLYPLPFNFIARWWRDLDYWIHTVGDSGYRSRIEKEAFDRGAKHSDSIWRKYVDDPHFLTRQMQEMVNERV